MAKVTEDLNGMTGAGVAAVKIKRLDNAISAWRETVSARMELSEEEVKRRDKVEAIMKEEGVKKYAYWLDDETQKDVLLDESIKVKMVAHKEVEAAEDLDNEDD